MPSVDSLVPVLATTEIFESLAPKFHLAIAKETDIREFAPGAKIVRQGDEGDELFLILSGAAHILIEDYALRTEQVVSELVAGQCFGETALLSSERRSATVKAREKTVCGVLSQARFETVLDRLPEVSRAVSRYLARRLAAQCRLTGFQYVTADQLVFEPRIYKAFQESVLRRFQAVPLELKGRTIRIAMTRPNNPEAIQGLQKEVPGLGLEPVACTSEDYQSFIHRYRSGVLRGAPAAPQGEVKIRRADGSGIGAPLDSILGDLVKSEESRLVLEAEPQLVETLIGRGGLLEPFQPNFIGEAARSLTCQLDDFLPLPAEKPAAQVIPVTVNGLDCQLAVSRLTGRIRTRYCLELTDFKSVVPPLRSLFPTEATLSLISQSINEPGRIIFLTGTKASGVSTTLYSLLDYKSAAGDPRNILLFEEKPLMSQQRILQFPLSGSLEPILSVAAAQRPELIAFDRLRARQIEELVFHPDSETTVLATFRGDDLLDVLASTARQEGGRASSLSRVSLLLNQRLVRKLCTECCEEYEPKPDELERLRESELDNELGRYYRGPGCESCHTTGVQGQIPLFEALQFSRPLLEALVGVRTSPKERLAALKESSVFNFRSFARLLISQGLIDPLEGLRLFPVQT